MKILTIGSIFLLLVSYHLSANESYSNEVETGTYFSNK